MKAFSRLNHIPPLIRFILLGSILELLYTLLCPLFPFQTSYPTFSLSSMKWLVIITSDQSLLSKISVSGTPFINTGSSPLFLTMVLIALASIYLILVANAFQADNNLHLTSRWLILPLIGALTFGLTLLVLPALFNHDVQNNIDKSVSLLFHLINCFLLWMILSRLAPARRLGGTILYAWNPLILIELVGNGHSYGLLIFVLLLTTLFIMQNKSQWYELWAMIFLGCASGFNLISLLLAPMFIYYCAMRITRQHTGSVAYAHSDQIITANPPATKSWSNNHPRLLWEFVWRAAVVSLTASILYSIFWPRGSFYMFITSSFDMRYLMHSPLSIIVLPVQWLNARIFHMLNPSNTLPPNYLQAIPSANMAVQASAIFIFILLYIYLFGKIRSVDSLLASLCLAILGFLILLVVQFWPWYVIWMLWIVALRRSDALSIGILLFSCTALLTYPFLYANSVPITMYQPLLIFGIPLIYLIARLARSNERMILFDDRRSETAKN
ncbi:MAG TPA: hypothetical protein VED37_17960 [Ktedonobacteraceae bacterium]|nr:hypothetical protein [Ktedonobacteraceae bacterium]